MKALFIVLAYCLGAVPFGYVFFRLSEKKDIRLFGSQSTGATNVLRLKGWKYAAPVVVFDVLKAGVPVWLALRLFDDRRVALAAAFMAVLGHCFPVFIRFRGGKGVSTAMGSYAVLAPLLFSLSLVVFVGVIAWTRYVSLGSLLAALSFPALALFVQGDGELALLGLAVFLLICLRHAGNIRRLCRSEERKFGQRLEAKD
jgi:glycerol-3-phosphate acyltransferase PlsY